MNVCGIYLWQNLVLFPADTEDEQTGESVFLYRHVPLLTH